MIRRRRLNWVGHLMRLPPETPARISIYEALRTTKRKRGKAKTTWLKVIEKDLSGNVKLDVFKDPAGNNYHEANKCNKGQRSLEDYSQEHYGLKKLTVSR